MSYLQPHLWIALPLLGESAMIPQLFGCFSEQKYKNYTLVVCLNQPESWHSRPDKSFYCLDNIKTLKLLKNQVGFALEVLDFASESKGLSDKQSGVGWARKLVMDYINTKAKDEDLIVSLDADTTFSPDYFDSIVSNFKNHHQSIALSVPYYHALTEDDNLNRAMLRYEIYMRYYAVNLWRIKSPYAFTALGSAMVIPVKSYRKVSGISPVKSGEDFYFLQKLLKSGNLNCYNPEKVYPAARLSDRVGFGTGPALIKGISGDWSSYPIYQASFFDEIGETYQKFPSLYLKDVYTPMSDFLEEVFKEKNFWLPLRKNSKNQQQFIRACHQKVDGLRLLQYLKTRQKTTNLTNEAILTDYVEQFQPQKRHIIPSDFSFENTGIEKLDEIRNEFLSIETEFQKKEVFLSLSNS